MKAAIIFIILGAMITAPVAVVGENAKVKDVNGNPVIAGEPYYIIFSGAWVSYFRRDENSPCPQVGVMSIDPLMAPRQPVLIYLESPPSVSSGEDHVLEDTEIRLKFQKMDDSCPDQTGIWKRTTYPEITTKILVTGTMESEHSTFRLTRANDGYFLGLINDEYSLVVNARELDEFGNEIVHLVVSQNVYGPQFRFEPVKM